MSDSTGTMPWDGYFDNFYPPQLTRITRRVYKIESNGNLTLINGE